MLNLAKRYGRICEALTKNEEPEFTIEGPSNSRASSSENAIWLEESKLLLKEKREYSLHCVTFTGIIMETLGSNIERMVRADEHFQEFYNDNKVLRLWKMIKDLCTKDAMQDLDDVKYSLWNTKQAKRSFDEYVLELEQRVKLLNDGNIKVNEDDLVLIFIKGLDQTRYGEHVADIRSTKGKSGYPMTYIAAKEVSQVYGRLRQLNGAASRNPENAMVVETREEKIMCYRCGGNHLRRDCEKRASEVKCDKCGKSGHVKKVCRIREEKANMAAVTNEPYDDWLTDENETYG
jgi:hypothetical protein